MSNRNRFGTVILLLVVLMLPSSGTAPLPPFELALCNNDPTLVSRHLGAGADPNLVFDTDPIKGWIPLTLALRFAPEICGGAGSRTVLLELLVNYGADVNKKPKDGDGATALMEAANNVNLTNVKFLLKHGADPNLTDDLGRTPLMFLGDAGNGKNVEIARVLIEHGADPSMQARDGATALSVAKLHERRDLANYLQSVIEDTK
ncbi:MAG: hypothetical protein MnENMB40S_00100 [Rhizobiaceae bacterium MnEN-MB40S]|nr:MAG: hypothetical protein MnENMB40S_00100 [Rhizobiaceae bacterium MnEN-MB40S]